MGFLDDILKPASFMEILDDLHTSMQSYHLKGVMELVKGEDQKVALNIAATGGIRSDDESKRI